MQATLEPLAEYLTNSLILKKNITAHKTMRIYKNIMVHKNIMIYKNLMIALLTDEAAEQWKMERMEKRLMAKL